MNKMMVIVVVVEEEKRRDVVKMLSRFHLVEKCKNVNCRRMGELVGKLVPMEC